MKETARNYIPIGLKPQSGKWSSYHTTHIALIAPCQELDGANISFISSAGVTLLTYVILFIIVN